MRLFDSELFRSALEGLSSHKLRSGLTALGVIFGVASVVGMASIGEGARREALRQIEVMGATNIIVDFKLPQDVQAAKEARATNPHGLTLEDAEAIKEIVPGAVRVVPQRILEFKISADDRSAEVTVVAAPPEIRGLNPPPLASGRWLSPLDERDAVRVCLLGWEAQRELFPIRKPLGAQVNINGQLFQVVGSLERQLTAGKLEGFELRDQNRDIYIPLSAALLRFAPAAYESPLKQIIVQMTSTKELNRAARLIERLMSRRHRNAGDFQVIVPTELLRQHQQTQRIFNIVMGTIASISLVVGGIGIMNIMLASVLERTREIGVRRAVGATRWDIARQFLAEAVLLSLFGGVVGVVLGFIIAKGISLYAGWETAVSLWAVIAAVGVSVSVGVLFGWLPARRAASLDPITALRFE